MFNYNGGMNDTEYKYIYVKDSAGELLGYIRRINKSEGTVWVKVVAVKNNEDSKWLNDVESYKIYRTNLLPILLKDVKEIQYYESYEEFCADHFTEIL
jgi:hypothetical protein